MTLLENSAPWYKKGVHFGCTECGQCCTGGPGVVWITDLECKAVATHLDISLEKFEQEYVRKIGARSALLEKKSDYACIFLEGKKCKVYQARPLQCRTFPFWPGVLESEQRWKEASLYCEGIDPKAPLISFEEIEQVLQLQRSSQI